MRLKLFTSILYLMLCSALQAQFFWPEDPEQRSKAELLWTLFDDAYKQGYYQDAKSHLDKILEKFPGLSRSVYINGIKVWKGIYKNEKDKTIKTQATENVMKLYQMRYDNFEGEKKKVIDRQAIDAFQYYFKDRSKTQTLLDLFKEAYELKGNEAYYPLGRYYMNMAAIAFTRNIGVTDALIMEIYDKCTAHIEYQIGKAKAANKSTKRHVAIKEFIDKKLADLNLIDCDFIVDKLVPEFQQDTTNAELANKIFVFAYEGGCTDEDWFVMAAETVFENSPQYAIGYLLGTRYGIERKYDKSKDYFVRAAGLTEDNTQKAKAWKQVAATERIKGNYAEARKYALQAAETDPVMKADMFTLIGDMIMASTECDKKVSQVDDRARFIAAHDYYIMAGNNTKAAQASAQFPTIGDIFTANKEEGQSLFVGCWIQKNVKLQRRPN